MIFVVNVNRLFGINFKPVGNDGDGAYWIVTLESYNYFSNKEVDYEIIAMLSGRETKKRYPKSWHRFGWDGDGWETWIGDRTLVVLKDKRLDRK